MAKPKVPSPTTRQPSTAVEKRNPVKDKMEAYRQQSWKEIQAQETVTTVQDEIGVDQWGAVVANESAKAYFVGHSFVIAFAQFNESDKGAAGEFVTLMLVDDKDERFILNDGSTGVYSQMRRRYPDKEVKELFECMMLCPKGLRRSDYTKEVYDPFKEQNVVIDATTYYLDTSI